MSGVEDLRARNREAVVKFLSLWGPEREKGRNALAHPDAILIRPASKAGETGPWFGSYQAWTASANKGYPNYGPTDYELYETADPNRFIGRTMSRGAKLFEDGHEEPVEWPYLFIFTMEDGKIKVLEEQRDQFAHVYPKAGLKLRYTTHMVDNPRDYLPGADKYEVHRPVW